MRNSGWGLVVLVSGCALLAPLSAQETLQNDVDDLDRHFSTEKAKMVAQVATRIANRVTEERFKKQHQDLAKRLDALEKAVGVHQERSRIEKLESDKLNKPEPSNVVIGGAAVITALCALIGILWHRTRRRDGG